MAGRRPEEHVRRPMLHQRWNDVSFIHWPCPPQTLRAVLPTGLEVDTFDGSGWISLIPLTIDASRLPLTPPLPRLSSFPETNLRTYVIGPDGRDGIWFFTLEADSLSTVVAARSLLGIPYRWAKMHVDVAAPRRTYVSQRRLRAPAAGHRIVVEPTNPEARRNGPLADWLTGRWRAWSIVLGRLVAVPVQHQPWPLVDAELVELEEDLIASAGLVRPREPPLVQFADGVDVRFGWPQPQASPETGYRDRHDRSTGREAD